MTDEEFKMEMIRRIDLLSEQMGDLQDAHRKLRVTMRRRNRFVQELLNELKRRDDDDGESWKNGNPPE